MKVVIVEDEKPAAEKLKLAIKKADPGIETVAVLNSVEEAIQWLLKNPQPDLIFMDIELSDGLSFEIFRKSPVQCPVIFITAYDEYWQEAFEHNSIDYLLKPVKQDKLNAALNKYELLKKHFAASFQQLMEWKQQESNITYKKRLLVKRGLDYVSLKTEDIAYCYATHKVICLVNNQNQKFILDKSLSDLEKDLNPSVFFRVNRKYLMNINAVKRIKAFSKGKLLLGVDPPVEEEIIISSENVTAFKEWIGS